MEGVEVTRSGRLFQTQAAATGKARSPMVNSRVWLTISDEDNNNNHNLYSASMSNDFRSASK